MHFLCHDTTLKKILSIEKLNLTWKMQTNFSKLGPLSKVFQIVVRGREDGKFAWGIFLLSGGILTRSDFDPSNLFKAKNNSLQMLSID